MVIVVVHIFFHSADDNMHFTLKALLSSCLKRFNSITNINFQSDVF